MSRARLLFISLLLAILLVLCCTSDEKADATSTTTMYVTQECWTYAAPGYLYNKLTSGMINILDKYQKVEVVRYEHPVFNGVAEIRFNNILVYMPNKYLTTTKTKGCNYSKVKSDKQITVSKDAIFRTYPSSKANKRTLDETQFYVLGETNSWYEVLYHSHSYFIKKNDSNITKISNKVYPQIVDIHEEDFNRFDYQFSCMPYRTIKLCLDKKWEFYIYYNYENSNIVTKLATIKNVYGVCYPLGKLVYMREGKDKFELSMHHEIGHMMHYNTGHITDARENITPEWEKKLVRITISPPKDVYEYIATGHDLYIKNYSYLKSNSPIMFKYYDSMFIG